MCSPSLLTSTRWPIVSRIFWSPNDNRPSGALNSLPRPGGERRLHPNVDVEAGFGVAGQVLDDLLVPDLVGMVEVRDIFEARGHRGYDVGDVAVELLVPAAQLDHWPVRV